jgi:hypothetical protein
MELNLNIVDLRKYPKLLNEVVPKVCLARRNVTIKEAMIILKGKFDITAIITTDLLTLEVSDETYMWINLKWK